MPKSVQFEGKSYSFPDDASDQEILGFLDQQSRPAPRPAPKPAPRPAPQPSAMPDIMDTFARAPGIVQQANQGGARAVQALTAPMAPESLNPTPAPPKATWRDSIRHGVQGVKTTFDLAAYGLERGARHVIGDNAVDTINAAGAAQGVQTPEQSLAGSIAKLNDIPRNMGVQRVGEAYAAGGNPLVGPIANFIMKLGSAGNALYHNPDAIPHLVLEMLPSLPLGGAGGKVVEGVGLKVAEELAPRLAPTIARSAFGAGFGATATLENAGPNTAAERAMDPNASLADIATRGTFKTLGQLPGSTVGGAALPFRVAKGSPSLAVRIGANTAAQAGIQAAAGVASVAGGNAALGRPTSEEEAAAAGFGNAAFGALGLGIEALNARRMAGDFEARRAAGGAEPEGVSPVGRDAAPHPEGGFAEDGNGFVADAKGKPVSFGAEADGGHVNAARFAAKNGLGGSHDISIVTDDQGVNHAVLKRRPAAPMAQEPAPETVTEPVTPAEEPPPAPAPSPAEAPAEAAPPAAVDPLSVGEATARGAAPEPALAEEGLLYDADGTPGRNEVGDQGPALEVEKGQGAPAPAADEGNRAPAAPAEALADGGSGPLEDRSGIGSDAKGSYRDTFEEASYTNRPSVYESAIHSAGLTPERFRLLPPERQAKVLADELEKATGVKVSVDRDMPMRESIDQMLDAHQTVQGMAHVLGISPKAISLGGKLGLTLKKNANFLGAYDPNGRRIFLPGRSNSFAHEWAHALDFHLRDKLAGSAARGITAHIRQQGAYFQPKGVAQAFAGVMNAMFFGDTALTQRVLDLQGKIAKTGSAQVRAQAQAELRRIIDGSSKARGIDTAFYQGAKHLNAKQGGGDYWTQPTEMFARAFEAYVSMAAEAQGLGTEFIGKGDANYQSVAEERFAKSFPHQEDRLKIFDAIDKLMTELQKEQAIDGDTGPVPFARGDVSRAADFDKRVPPGPKGNVLKQQMDAIRRQAQRKTIELEGRAEDPKGQLEWTADWFSQILFSTSGELKMLWRRYNKAGVILDVHDRLTTDPGSGRKIARTFHETKKIMTRKFEGRIANILKANGYEAGLNTAEEIRQLRALLTGKGEPDQWPQLVKVASGMRQLYDELWYELNNALARNGGKKAGYVHDQGYVNRALDTPRVENDRPGFRQKAAQVYEIKFDRDVGASAAEIVKDDARIEAFAKIARANQLSRRGDTLSKARQAHTAASQSGDPQAQAQAAAQLTAAIDQIFDAVRSAYATGMAEAWDRAIFSIEAADYDRTAAHMAGGDFTKSRSLPKEADEILAGFYIQDPIESLMDYTNAVASKVAWETHFGTRFMSELGGRMEAAGVKIEDQRSVIEIINTLTGRMKPGATTAIRRGLARIQATGMMVLLPRAVLSSLAEGAVAGMVTANMLDSIKGLVKTATGAKSLSDRDLIELSQALGAVEDAMHQEIIFERFAGHYADNPRLDRMMGRMFQRTGLVGLTRMQRRAAVGIGFQFIDRLVKSYLKGDAEAGREMGEYGVRDVDAFAKEWDRRGGAFDIGEGDHLTKFGEDVETFINRFTDRAVQDPDPASRPRLAQNPAGRIMYGIMGFTMSFWRNVQKPAFKKAFRLTAEGKFGKAGAYSFLGVLPSALLYLAVSTAVSSIREFFLNRQRWEDREKAGDLPEYLAGLGLTRTFPAGIADPLVQSVTGLKYQRDLSNMFIGPAPGFFVQNGQAVMMSFIRDSDAGDLNKAGDPKKFGTNTAEFNRDRAIYNVMIAPSVSMGLASLPGGPILSPLEGAGMALFTAPGAGAAAAEIVDGPKGSKTDEGGNIVEGGGRHDRSSRKSRHAGR